MKRFFALSILAFCWVQAVAQTLTGSDIPMDYSAPREYELGGVEVEGAEGLDKGVLVQSTDLIIGQEITIPGGKIAKAIKNLWELNLFSDISIVATRVEGKTIFLKILLEERPRLSKFTISGIRKGEADDIREKIKLIKGKIVTENLVVNTRNRVRDHFVDKGYLDAEVEITQVPDTSLQNNVILNIRINKQKKVRIKSIIFEGNSSISSRKLRRYMKETKQYAWWNIFKSSKYLEENFKGDKESLLAKYNSKGFRDAAIVHDTTYRVSKRYINLVIKMEEGHRYYFRNITWVGNTKYSSDELSRRLNIRRGEVFNQQALDQKVSSNPEGGDISSLYMDDGYLFFQINPVEVSVENDSIDLEMRIYEGKQARINKVTVVGNTKTNDRVVLREIRTRPGQLFNRSDIMRTQRELAQLRYFDEQKLGVVPKPNPADGTVDIEYTVEERPSDQVELSAGWGNRALVGTLGLSFNNFSARNLFRRDAWKPLPAGDGQSLVLRAQSTGRAFQNYTASFIEPWLGGKRPNSFSVSIFHSRQNPLAVSLDDERLQLLTVTGVTIGLGKRLKKPDDWFQLYQEITFQRYFLQNFRSGINFSFTDGKAINMAYKLNISRSSINAPIYPTSGSQVAFTLQFTPPYSLFRKGQTLFDELTYYSGNRDAARWVEYHKWKFTTNFFTELAPKLVFNARAGFGIVGSYNSRLGYSPFERFWLGGSGLTGFALDGREVIALRGFAGAGDATEGNSGGVAIAKYVFELRYPFSLNPSATIYGLTFAEAGNAWGSVRKFNPFSVARCAGVGLRVFLPMFGLLGLDYGWGFDNPWGKGNNGNGQGHFQFTIGTNIGDL